MPPCAPGSHQDLQNKMTSFGITVKRQELYAFFNSAETITFVILESTSILYWNKRKNLTPGFRTLRKVA